MVSTQAGGECSPIPQQCCSGFAGSEVAKDGAMHDALRANSACPPQQRYCPRFQKAHDLRWSQFNMERKDPVSDDSNHLHDSTPENRDGIELAKRVSELLSSDSIPKADMDADDYDGSESIEDYQRRKTR